VRRHIHVQDTTRRVFHKHKDVEEPRGRRHHHTEVTGDDRLSTVADKGPLALGRDAVVPTTIEALGHILAHGTGRQAQAKLQEQFVGNPLLTSRWVVTGHPVDEHSQLRRMNVAGWTMAKACHQSNQRASQSRAIRVA
jgi:hypothetical protein